MTAHIGGLPADPLAEARAIVGYATDRNGMIPDASPAELLALAQTHAAIAQAAALERIAAALEQPDVRIDGQRAVANAAALRQTRTGTAGR
jgi:hypothetical protein